MGEVCRTATPILFRQKSAVRQESQLIFHPSFATYSNWSQPLTYALALLQARLGARVGSTTSTHNQKLTLALMQLQACADTPHASYHASKNNLKGMPPNVSFRPTKHLPCKRAPNAALPSRRRAAGMPHHAHCPAALPQRTRHATWPKRAAPMLKITAMLSVPPHTRNTSQVRRMARPCNTLEPAPLQSQASLRARLRFLRAA